MALIPCPECKTEVSSAAAACPKCGHPIAAPTTPPPQPQRVVGAIDMRDPVHVVGVVIAVVMLIAIVIWFLLSIQKPF
jgi:hypothetical protein